MNIYCMQQLICNINTGNCIDCLTMAYSIQTHVSDSVKPKVFDLQFLRSVKYISKNDSLIDIYYETSYSITSSFAK